jgi:hypothetical protein
MIQITKASAKLKLGILLERKNLFFYFFFLKNEPCKVLLNIILSNDKQLFLENRERRFSKIIYA